MRNNCLCRLLTVWCLFAVVIACIEDPVYKNEIINATVPTISEATSLESKTATSATLTAAVDKANGSEVTERGFCWSSTSPALLKEENRVISGKGLGEYKATVSNLSNNATYYIRPYAKNEKGIAYGQEVEVITNDGLGVVKTMDVIDFSAATASVKGQIVQKGEGKLLQAGFYYSLDEKMVEKDSFLVEVDNDMINALISGLIPARTYYFRAFVTNTFGTFAGEIKRFKTADGLFHIKDFKTVTIGYRKLAFYASFDDRKELIVKQCGFSISTDEYPEKEKAKTILCDFSNCEFQGEFIDLSPDTKYYVRAFVLNQYGLSYSEQLVVSTKSEMPEVKTLEAKVVSNGVVRFKGEVVDAGGSPVYEKGFCWSIENKIPTVDDNVVQVEGYETGSVYETSLSGFKGNMYYYVRAYAENNQGISYGDVVRLLTPQKLEDGLAFFPGKIFIQGSPALFIIGDQAYLLGGDEGNGYSDQLWSYNTYSDLWTELKSQPHGPLQWQTAVAHGSNAYVLGGIDPSNKRKNDFYKYNSLNNMWYSLPKPTDSIHSSVGCSYGDFIYYIGGMKPASSSNVRAFNPLNNSWQERNPFPVKQYGGVALTIGDTVYAGLGKNDSESCNKTLWRSTGILDHWTVETVCGDLTGGILGGLSFNDKIYILDESYTFFEYNTIDKQWKKKSTLPVAFQKILFMFEMNNVIYLCIPRKHISSNAPNTLIMYYPLWDN